MNIFQSENRKLRDKQRKKNILLTTEVTTAATTPRSSSARANTRVTSPTSLGRPDSRVSLKSRYKSAEANYLALRGRNNYKARQYTSSTTSSTTTSPGKSTLDNLILVREAKFQGLCKVVGMVFAHQMIFSLEKKYLRIFARSEADIFRNVKLFILSIIVHRPSNLETH